MEFKYVFDLIPEEFDRSRPRYTQAAFDEIIRTVGLGPGRSMVEIGPGTGQATEPLLKSGCDYLGVELGEHLYRFLADRFRGCPNFRAVNDDFLTHDFGTERFDLVFSAATIQWLPEEQAFRRCHELLKPGGWLIMIANIGDETARNSPELIRAKNEVYERYFRPEIRYDCHINKMNVVNYGFETPSVSDHVYDHDLTADEYVALTMTNADHILLKEPDRTAFTEGLRKAVNDHGGIWKCRDRVNIVKARRI